MTIPAALPRRAPTYPGPRTLASESAVNDAKSTVHDAALGVAVEFDGLLARVEREYLPERLRLALVKLSAAFVAESAAYAEFGRISDEEWEAWLNKGDR